MQSLNPRGDLPDFSNPPVIEVSLALQFERLVRLRTAHLGVLWNQFRERFPRTEEHPPRESVVERFDVPGPPAMRIQLQTVMPVPRVWFLNDRGTEVIQIQQDCFAHNWRKMGMPAEAYPRYETIRQTFSEELHAFLRFIEEEQLGKVSPTQCEVTYVNHILPGGDWKTPGQAELVLAPWSGRHNGAFLPTPEETRIAIRYVIPGQNGEPVGRLRVVLSPAVDTKTQSRLLVLTLTARGRPGGGEPENVLAFLDKGREWIVRGFAALTTPEMQRVWGRRDNAS